MSKYTAQKYVTLTTWSEASERHVYKHRRITITIPSNTDNTKMWASMLISGRTL